MLSMNFSSIWCNVSQHAAHGATCNHTSQRHSKCWLHYNIVCLCCQSSQSDSCGVLRMLLSRLHHQVDHCWWCLLQHFHEALKMVHCCYYHHHSCYYAYHFHPLQSLGWVGMARPCLCCRPSLCCLMSYFPWLNLMLTPQTQLRCLVMQWQGQTGVPYKRCMCGGIVSIVLAPWEHSHKQLKLWASPNNLGCSLPSWCLISTLRRGGCMRQMSSGLRTL